MKRTVEINSEYGYLTVLKEVERDNFDHRQYLVRCRCGKEYIVRKGFLFSSEPKCKECASREYHERVVGTHVGSMVNGFEIINENSKTKSGAIIYKCRCLKCNSIVYRTSGDLSVRKGHGCEFCKPDYHFRIYGNTAVGQLPDGSEFLIDTQNIGLVSAFSWKSKDGYVVCSNSGKNKGVKLHQLVLGIGKNSNLTVDHINRNRKDCRISNLRIVTLQQNSMNRSIQKNNTTGFVGVTSFQTRGKYTARIGINYKYIVVYRSVDPIECAQAYNYASELLFRQFSGHRNDVPEASDEIKAEVHRKCMPFFKQSEMATSPIVIIQSA